jgi:spermidine synthase
VLLALVPSSLMLSVTSYLTTNLTPFPLLWVIPLAIYLLSFVIVYMTRPLIPHRLVQRLLPWVLTPLVIAVALLPTQLVWGLVPLHLLGLFVVSLACHGALAADRPNPAALTEYYLWVSVGGALGGIFNGLLAPLLFTNIAEYPLGLVLAALFGTSASTASRRRWDRLLDVGWPLAMGLALGALALVVGLRTTGSTSRIIVAILACVLPALLSMFFMRRPVRYAMGVAVVLILGGLFFREPGVLHAERNFFGVVRVVMDEANNTHRLLHGDTLHGMQSMDPELSCEPLSYYQANGPIGQLFAQIKAGPTKERIAVVGLGAGCLAGYAQPEQQWTYYEIDPAVERIARDPRYFTFLTDCAPQTNVIIGDARLSLAKAPSAAYDLIVLDAYSSDSVPVHLITREALALYLNKLAPDGLLAFHISNRYLDLQPVLGNLAQDAKLHAIVRFDDDLPQSERALKSPSRWVLMARNAKSFGAIGVDPHWQLLLPAPGQRLWTDDYSSIFSVIRWQ